MPSDYNNNVTQDQQRISNSDRSHSTRYHFNNQDQDEDLKRYEAMNRRNWVAVLSFVGVVLAIFLVIILLSIF